jgi:hypothetical protein
MENYYSSNALYDYLQRNPTSNFKFVVGNMWQLVYGDNNCIPKSLVLAVGVHKSDYEMPLNKAEQDAYNQLHYISTKCKIPLFYVRFIADGEILGVKTISENGGFVNLSMQELTQKFESFGLPTSNRPTAKYLNDKSSSAYHSWQRNSLGSALTVSDIDLWKLDVNDVPSYFYELKRSFYSLERWKPFTDDYRNFRLLSNLALSAGIGFRIAYNVREKNPFKDDVSKLKVFDVDFSKQTPITEKGIFELNNFWVQ